MDIAGNLKKMHNSLPESVKLVAVSKTHGPETIMEAYNAGHRAFGENRVQEMMEKQPVLPGDIEWHHIGHLQTNKVKYLAPFVSMIHAVDSMKLLKEVNKQAAKFNRVIPCLLQVHIAEEETKFGLSGEELSQLIEGITTSNFPNISLAGLMGMATFTEDTTLVRKEFRFLKRLFDNIKINYKDKLPQFKELSMGMSGDYSIAVEEGSTIVRVGSLIFGERE
jgi:pyridoxal phosphate enzyme (YggS family)